MISKKSAFLWLAIVAGIYVYETFSEYRKLGDDFHTCNIQATEFTMLEQKTMSIPMPTKRQHDETDDWIHICMLGKGYIYTPTRWAKCPSEKIQMCYRTATFIDTIKSLF